MRQIALGGALAAAVLWLTPGKLVYYLQSIQGK